MERRVAAAKAAGGALMVASAIIAAAMTGMLSPLEIGSTPGRSGDGAQPATETVPATTAALGTTTSSVSVARIPSDWPAATPIPPIPSGCGNPVLALNGQWGCQ